MSKTATIGPGPHRRKKSRCILAAAALALGAATATPAQAWTLIPGIPQPITVALHFAGGFAMAAYLDHRAGMVGDAGDASTRDKAIAIATGIGFAKELMDVTFYFDDFIAWPIGAAAYYQVKKSPDCFGPPAGEMETDWYIPRQGCTSKRVAGATQQ